MSTGMIADIQRASVHDGPGIRTTVFFKGCPLNCQWCHNPECISSEPQVLMYPEKCIHCGDCEQGCFSGAKVVCGKEYTPEQLLEEILMDKDYFGSNGGVTFSGGEPFAQPEFLSEMVDLCHKSAVHCAAETSLIIYNESILKKLDLVMADLKIWDDALHQEYTGVSNQRIKEHFVRLNGLDIPVIARTPLIPGINQQIEEISQFLRGLKNVMQYELLPYHPLGNSKRTALGLEEQQFPIPEKAYMKALSQYAFSRV